MIGRIISVLVTLGLTGSRALALSLLFLFCRFVALPSCGSLVGPLSPVRLTVVLFRGSVGHSYWCLPSGIWLYLATAPVSDLLVLFSFCHLRWPS